MVRITCCVLLLFTSLITVVYNIFNGMESNSVLSLSVLVMMLITTITVIRQIRGEINNKSRNTVVDLGNPTKNRQQYKIHDHILELTMTEREQILLGKLINRVWVDEKVVLRSGATSDYYLDCRRASMSALCVSDIGVVFYEKLNRYWPEAIGGPADAAIPLVTSVVAAFGNAGSKYIEGFFTRKETKDHGLQRLIEEM